MSHSLGILSRCVAVVLTVMMLAVIPADAQTRKKTTRTSSPTRQRTMESVKKDKTNTERKISETSTRIQTNAQELNRQLNKLNSLNADIEATRSQAEGLRQHIDSLGNAINVTADSINSLNDELESMRRAYVKALKDLQPHAGAANDLSFIFSAETFAEAYSRIRYLRQFSAWRERKAQNIRDAVERISDRRAHLTSLRHSQDKAYRKAEETQQTLSKQQAQSEQMVNQLRKEDSALRRSLNEQKQKAAALDRELDRLIAAEQARIAREEEAARRRAEKAKEKNKTKPAATATKPATSKETAAHSATETEKPSAKAVASANATTQTAAAADLSALSGSFAANKGRLLFPVAGKYKVVRRFGRQPHPTLPHVETDNSGIDIEVGTGSEARSVFAGSVSAIFKQDGFNSIVMIRHGRYITIYAGLASVNVKPGDVVKAGQTLGRIYSDPEDGNRTILHFEIRNERQKLNPSQWVR
ncbi:MAG: peptidoglycan DD-metalloendopeptidase family protein [Duncaniella sp.]|nr:peptidoglycan DD-metalloendopeptidase family protein [Duncaniella sp.]